MSPASARQSQAEITGSATMILQRLAVISMLPLLIGAHEDHAPGHDTLKTDLEGRWGHWSDIHLCPASGQTHRKVVDFVVQVEAPGGTFSDHTALNGVRMKCDDGSIIGVDGREGDWGNWRSECQDGFNAFQFQLQEPQGFGLGSNDDNAGNNVKMHCPGGFPDSSNKWRAGANEWAEGHWSSTALCPPGESICGFRLKVESYQGMLIDDTATNAIRMQCCPPPPPPVAACRAHDACGAAEYCSTGDHDSAGVCAPCVASGGGGCGADAVGGACPAKCAAGGLQLETVDRAPPDGTPDAANGSGQLGEDEEANKEHRNGHRHHDDDDDDDDNGRHGGGHEHHDKGSGVGGAAVGAIAGAAAGGLLLGVVVGALMCARRRRAQQRSSLAAMNSMREKKNVAMAERGPQERALAPSPDTAAAEMVTHLVTLEYDAEAGGAPGSPGGPAPLTLPPKAPSYAPPPEEPALGQPALGTGAFQVEVPPNMAPGTVMQVTVPEGYAHAGQSVPFCVPAGLPPQGGAVMVPLPVAPM